MSVLISEEKQALCCQPRPSSSTLDYRLSQRKHCCVLMALKALPFTLSRCYIYRLPHKQRRGLQLLLPQPLGRFDNRGAAATG